MGPYLRLWTELLFARWANEARKLAILEWPGCVFES
jgi:hypothetical protein